MFGIKNAGFNVREQVANLIVLLALIASAGPCVLAKINPGAGSLVEFQRHLAYLKTDAEREGYLPMSAQFRTLRDFDLQS